jgi:hypothetical protein
MVDVYAACRVCCDFPVEGFKVVACRFSFRRDKSADVAEAAGIDRGNSVVRFVGVVETYEGV